MNAIRCVLVACAAASISSLATAVEAGAETSAWHTSVGFKLWSNDWSSWDVSRVQSGGGAFDVLTEKASDHALSVIPVLSVRRGRWIIAASHMTSTHYTLRNALGALEGTRSETDVNVGADLVPGLALIVGYKQLTQDAGGRFQWKGPTLAVNASLPFGSGWALYGTYGLGALKLTLPATDLLGRDKLPAMYSLSEWGLARSFGRSDSAVSPSLVLALGYRAQSVKTRDYALLSQPVGGGAVAVYGTDTLRDFTQGFTLSLIGSF